MLGPIAFPLDRLIAILGVLLEENDADARPHAPEYTIPGEYTEIEISRVAIFAQVSDDPTHFPAHSFLTLEP